MEELDRDTTPLTPRDLQESADLLGKVHELSSKWNTTRSHGATADRDISKLTSEYIEAVNKAYEKLNENVIKTASQQTRI